MRSNKDKVYFSINGIGYGHSARMLSLIKYFLNNGYLVYVSTYNEGAKFLENYYKNIFVIKGYSYIFDESGRLSFKNTISKNLLKYPIILTLHLILELKNLLIIKPKLVISDSRASSILAAYLLRINRVIFLNQLYVEIPRIRPMSKLTRLLKRISERIFYELWLWVCSKAFYIFIPDLKPPYSLSSKNILINKLNLKDKIYFTGPILNIENKENKINDQNNNKIVFLLSGTIQERLISIKKFINIINKNEKTNLYFIILSGLKNFNKIKKGNYEIIPWVEEEEIIKLVSEAKAVVSTGGHSSIMLALQLMKPLLIIVPRAHTEKAKNAMKAKELGIAEYLVMDELDEVKFLSSLEHVLKLQYNEKIKQLLNEYNSRKILIDLIND